MPRLLLCCDLDGTLLPNTGAALSSAAHDAFRSLASRDDVTLVFVTGRSRALVEAAMQEYDLPAPDFVIGDVGTSIHRVAGGRWRACPAWDEVMAADWAGVDRTGIVSRLAAIAGLVPQEDHKQNRFKASFYAPPDTDADRLTENVARCLAPLRMAWQSVFSIDEVAGVALFDVIPAAGGKLNAVACLQQRLDVAEHAVLFAGDSGNDLDVLTSGLPAVLVANARADVARQALARARERGTATRLYLARGGFNGMNGNYAAGILEGAAHFHPWLFDAGGSA